MAKKTRYSGESSKRGSLIISNAQVECMLFIIYIKMYHMNAQTYMPMYDVYLNQKISFCSFFSFLMLANFELTLLLLAHCRFIKKSVNEQKRV